MKFMNCIALYCVLELCNLYITTARVLELDERFPNVQSEGLWLVMFYAPWCGHCKNLEPTWIEVGATLSQANSQVNVARLDATKYSSIASHYQVRGFPTIKFFKHGHQIEYNGGRTKQSIISFVNKAQGPEVSKLSDKQSFVETRNQHDVFFVYVGDEDTQLHKKYVGAARKLFTSMSFYSASSVGTLQDVSSTSPTTVMVFKDGKYYEFSQDVMSIELLGRWIMAEQFPSYNHLSGLTYHTLRASGRKFAIAVLEGEDDPFNTTMNQVALQRKHPFTFCWVEGNNVVNRMTYSSITAPNLVIYDTASHEYHVMRQEDRQPQLSIENVAQFFKEVSDGSIPALGGRGVKEQAKRVFGDLTGFIVEMFTTNPLISSFVVIVPTILITGFCVCLCSMTDDVQSEYDEDSGNEEGVENEDDVKLERGEEGPSFEPEDPVESPDTDGVRRRVKGEETS